MKNAANNTLIGAQVGNNYTGSESSNIIIGFSTSGTASESHVLRIGNATGTSSGNLNSAFIQGINGITPSGTPIPVFINSSWSTWNRWWYWISNINYG